MLIHTCIIANLHRFLQEVEVAVEEDMMTDRATTAGKPATCHATASNRAK